MGIAGASKVDDFYRTTATLLQQDILLEIHKRNWNMVSLAVTSICVREEAEIIYVHLPVSDHNGLSSRGRAGGGIL